MMRAILVVLLGLITTSAGLAQGIEDDNWCRAGFFTRDNNTFRIAVVSGKPSDRIYFYNDYEDNCPQAESCRAKTYVVPGDKVVMSRYFGDFACVWFTPVKGSPTIGWIKSRSLKLSEEPQFAPALSAWLGEWRYAESVIRFTNNKLAGFLNVTGDALWRGTGDNVHVGEIDDRASPERGVLRIGHNAPEDSVCKVEMKIVEEFLIVTDNMKCGGANVSFSGVYKKAR